MKTVKTLAVLAVAAVAVAGSAFAQETETQEAANQASSEKKTMSLADARNQIEAVVEKPEKMGDIMSQLSKEDQITFLGDVNKAIEAKSMEPAVKAETFLAVNRAAIGSAKDVVSVIAEVYATVPEQSLPSVSEGLAANLSKVASNAKTTTGAFTTMGKMVISKVAERTAGSQEANTRNLLAVMAFAEAAASLQTEEPDQLGTAVDTTVATAEGQAETAGTQAEAAGTQAETTGKMTATQVAVVEALTESLNEDVRSQANDMVSTAMATDTPFEAIVDAVTDATASQPTYASAAATPSSPVVPLRVSGAETGAAVTTDVGTDLTDFTDSIRAQFSDPVPTDAAMTKNAETPGMVVVDGSGNESKTPWDPGTTREESTPITDDVVVEPSGYQNQTTTGTVASGITTGSGI